MNWLLRCIFHSVLMLFLLTSITYAQKKEIPSNEIKKSFERLVLSANTDQQAQEFKNYLEKYSFDQEFLQEQFDGLSYSSNTKNKSRQVMMDDFLVLSGIEQSKMNEVVLKKAATEAEHFPKVMWEKIIPHLSNNEATIVRFLVDVCDKTKKDGDIDFKLFDNKTIGIEIKESALQLTIIESRLRLIKNILDNSITDMKQFVPEMLKHEATRVSKFTDNEEKIKLLLNYVDRQTIENLKKEKMPQNVSELLNTYQHQQNLTQSQDYPYDIQKNTFVQRWNREHSYDPITTSDQLNDKLRVRGLTKLLTKAEALEILADQWTRIYPYLDEHLPIEYRRTSWDLESSKWLASHWSEIHKNVPGSLGEYSMISYLHDAAGISRDVGRSMLMDIYSKKNPYHEILAKEFQKEKLSNENSIDIGKYTFVKRWNSDKKNPKIETADDLNTELLRVGVENLSNQEILEILADQRDYFQKNINLAELTQTLQTPYWWNSAETVKTVWNQLIPFMPDLLSFNLIDEMTYEISPLITQGNPYERMNVFFDVDHYTKNQFQLVMDKSNSKIVNAVPARKNYFGRDRLSMNPFFPMNDQPPEWWDEFRVEFPETWIGSRIFKKLETIDQAAKAGHQKVVELWLADGTTTLADIQKAIDVSIDREQQNIIDLLTKDSRVSDKMILHVRERQELVRLEKAWKIEKEGGMRLSQYNLQRLFRFSARFGRDQNILELTSKLNNETNQREVAIDSRLDSREIISAFRLGAIHQFEKIVQFCLDTQKISLRDLGEMIHEVGLIDGDEGVMKVLLGADLIKNEKIRKLTLNQAVDEMVNTELRQQIFRHAHREEYGNLIHHDGDYLLMDALYVLLQDPAIEPELKNQAIDLAIANIHPSDYSRIYQFQNIRVADRELVGKDEFQKIKEDILKSEERVPVFEYPRYNDFMEHTFNAESKIRALVLEKDFYNTNNESQKYGYTKVKALTELFNQRIDYLKSRLAINSSWDRDLDAFENVVKKYGINDRTYIEVVAIAFNTKNNDLILTLSEDKRWKSALQDMRLYAVNTHNNVVIENLKWFDGKQKKQNNKDGIIKNWFVEFYKKYAPIFGEVVTLDREITDSAKKNELSEFQWAIYDAIHGQINPETQLAGKANTLVKKPLKELLQMPESAEVIKYLGREFLEYAMLFSETIDDPKILNVFHSVFENQNLPTEVRENPRFITFAQEHPIIVANGITGKDIARSLRNLSSTMENNKILKFRKEFVKRAGLGDLVYIQKNKNSQKLDKNTLNNAFTLAVDKNKNLIVRELKNHKYIGSDIKEIMFLLAASYGDRRKETFEELKNEVGEPILEKALSEQRYVHGDVLSPTIRLEIENILNGENAEANDRFMGDSEHQPIYMTSEYSQDDVVVHANGITKKDFKKWINTSVKWLSDLLDYNPFGSGLSPIDVYLHDEIMSDIVQGKNDPNWKSQIVSLLTTFESSAKNVMKISGVEFVERSIELNNIASFKTLLSLAALDIKNDKTLITKATLNALMTDPEFPEYDNRTQYLELLLDKTDVYSDKSLTLAYLLGDKEVFGLLLKHSKYVQLSDLQKYESMLQSELTAEIKKITTESGFVNNDQFLRLIEVFNHNKELEGHKQVATDFYAYLRRDQNQTTNVANIVNESQIVEKKPGGMKAESEMDEQSKHIFVFNYVESMMEDHIDSKRIKKELDKIELPEKDLTRLAFKTLEKNRPNVLELLSKQKNFNPNGKYSDNLTLVTQALELKRFRSFVILLSHPNIDEQTKNKYVLLAKNKKKFVKYIEFKDESLLVKKVLPPVETPAADLVATVTSVEAMIPVEPVVEKTPSAVDDVVDLLNQAVHLEHYGPMDVINYVEEIKHDDAKRVLWNNLLDAMGIRTDITDLTDPAAKKFFEYALYIHKHGSLGSRDKLEGVVALRQIGSELFKDRIQDQGAYNWNFQAACDALIFGQQQSVMTDVSSLFRDKNYRLIMETSDLNEAKQLRLLISNNDLAEAYLNLSFEQEALASENKKSIIDYLRTETYAALKNGKISDRYLVEALIGGDIDLQTISTSRQKAEANNNKVAKNTLQRKANFIFIEAVKSPDLGKIIAVLPDVIPARIDQALELLNKHPDLKNSNEKPEIENSLKLISDARNGKLEDVVRNMIKNKINIKVKDLAMNIALDGAVRSSPKQYDYIHIVHILADYVSDEQVQNAMKKELLPVELKKLLQIKLDERNQNGSNNVVKNSILPITVEQIKPLVPGQLLKKLDQISKMGGEELGKLAKNIRMQVFKGLVTTQLTLDQSRQAIQYLAKASQIEHQAKEFPKEFGKFFSVLLVLELKKVASRDDVTIDDFLNLLSQGPLEVLKLATFSTTSASVVTGWGLAEQLVQTKLETQYRPIIIAEAKNVPVWGQALARETSLAGMGKMQVAMLAATLVNQMIYGPKVSGKELVANCMRSQAEFFLAQITVQQIALRGLYAGIKYSKTLSSAAEVAYTGAKTGSKLLRVTPVGWASFLAQMIIVDRLEEKYQKDTTLTQANNNMYESEYDLEAYLRGAVPSKVCDGYADKGSCFANRTIQGLRNYDSNALDYQFKEQQAVLRKKQDGLDSIYNHTGLWNSQEEAVSKVSTGIKLEEFKQDQRKAVTDYIKSINPRLVEMQSTIPVAKRNAFYTLYTSNEKLNQVMDEHCSGLDDENALQAMSENEVFVKLQKCDAEIKNYQMTIQDAVQILSLSTRETQKKYNMGVSSWVSEPMSRGEYVDQALYMIARIRNLYATGHEELRDQATNEMFHHLMEAVLHPVVSKMHEASEGVYYASFHAPLAYGPGYYKSIEKTYGMYDEEGYKAHLAQQMEALKHPEQTYKTDDFHDHTISIVAANPAEAQKKYNEIVLQMMKLFQCDQKSDVFASYLQKYMGIKTDSPLSSHLPNQDIGYVQVYQPVKIERLGSGLNQYLKTYTITRSQLYAQDVACSVH